MRGHRRDAGQGGQVDITAARVCVGDLSGMSLDDALFAVVVAQIYCRRELRNHPGGGVE